MRSERTRGGGGPRRLDPGELRGPDGATAILGAAGRTVNCDVGCGLSVALVRGFAQAARVRIRGQRLQSDGRGGPENREDQQESGNRTLHAFLMRQNP